MSKKKRNEKTLIEKISPIINIIIIIGFMFTLIIEIDKMLLGDNDTKDMIILIVIFISLAISTYIQIIIHEVGHLIFGIFSGYKFVSFRIGNLMLIKTKNKLKLKTLKLAGTGGQCLMAPPNLIDNKMPVKLYNFGGSIMNLAISIILLIIAYFTKNSQLLSYSLEILAIVGFLYAAQNGIPMKTAEIDNDGLNAISLNKHPEAQKAFWIQLKVNAEITNGKRLKDMPKEWFEMPKDKDMKNSMIATMGVLACNYAMEMHNFEEANKSIKHILKIKSGIVGVHKNLLINDRIYCELINGNISETKKLLNQTQKNFMQTMKDYPAIIRTEYAISLLLDKNEEKAKEIKKKFIARGKTYPYSSDIKGEKELIDIATNISKN